MQAYRAWLRSYRWLLIAGFVLTTLLPPAPVLGQVATDSARNISRQFARHGQQMPVEKLYAHLDRPSYVSGETLWLKLYAVEGSRHQPLASSTVAYVEVLNGQQVPVVQTKLALRNATGQGSVVLPPELPSGSYTVRVYTSWMKNFGPEYYFHTPITISNTRVAAGAAPPPGAGYEARFFPEGGYLVRGLTSTVGFRLTDAAGRGAEGQGTVLDPTGRIVARFRPLRYGLGSFSFTPAETGTAYKAVVTFPDQPARTYDLPPVRAQGYVLRLEDDDATQLRVVVQATTPAPEKLYLLGHARHQVTAAATGQLQAGRAVFLVPRQQVRAGVSHFTLFNGRRQPVCERLYFRAPTDTLPLRVRSDQPHYQTRKKVTLALAAGGPTATNLSVAVYQLDSLSRQAGSDITSYLWLGADVKGRIENPAYYLKTTNRQAADNLMLTQGWSRFSWNNILADTAVKPAFPPELHGHLVRGRVLDSRTSAPVAGQRVYLTAPSRFPRLYNALSQPDGSILVEVPDWYGTKQVIAQTDPRPGDAYRVELLSPFSADFAAERAGPFALSERFAPTMLRRHVQAEVQQYYARSGPARYRSPLTDSLPFYGKPSEQYLLDKYTRFKTLEDVMREYVPGVLVRARKDGFHLVVPDKANRTTMENPLVLLDGMPVFDINRIMAFDPLKIRRLDVVTNRYVVGPAVHDGVVSYTTYSGDLAGFQPDAQALLQTYEGLQGQRDFYAPHYDTPAAAQSRLPDFRNLLHWAPQVTTDPAGKAALSFYTSDQIGTYRVVVQGISQEGHTGSANFTFEVKAVQ